MKNIFVLIFIAFAIVLSSLTSCNDDDIQIPNEEELITTLTYILTPEGTGNPVIFSFRDLDGDGGEDPVISEGILAANTIYTGTVVLLNELETPNVNIAAEVEEEGDEHQFFYGISGAAELTILYDDEDVNGSPVGLSTTVETGNTSTGQLTITLRHEPDKSAPGVSEGNIANAGGETDISVTFNVSIQ